MSAAPAARESDSFSESSGVEAMSSLSVSKKPSCRYAACPRKVSMSGASSAKSTRMASPRSPRERNCSVRPTGLRRRNHSNTLYSLGVGPPKHVPGRVDSPRRWIGAPRLWTSGGRGSDSPGGLSPPEQARSHDDFRRARRRSGHRRRPGIQGHRGCLPDPGTDHPPRPSGPGHHRPGKTEPARRSASASLWFSVSA